MSAGSVSDQRWGLGVTLAWRPPQAGMLVERVAYALNNACTRSDPYQHDSRTKTKHENPISERLCWPPPDQRDSEQKMPRQQNRWATPSGKPSTQSRLADPDTSAEAERVERSIEPKQKGARDVSRSALDSHRSG